MDFNLSDEQAMLREGVSRYVREQCAFSERHKNMTREALDRRWADYSEMGWLGLSLPESAGGIGASFVESAIVMEEFGRGLVMDPYLENAIFCSRILEQSKNGGTLLERMAKGDLRLAMAHAEDGLRYAVDHVSATRASSIAGGFVLSGRKLLCLAAPLADSFIVSAALQDGSGMALLLVPAGATGVKFKPYTLLDGSDAADIDFTEVRLDEDALLASGRKAQDLLGEAIDRATLAAVAEALGVMEAAVALAADHLKTRVQFKQPLGKFQALQHIMAECFVELQETRSILYRGIAGIDGDAESRAEAVSYAKAYAGPSAKLVGANCVQVHGAIGITEEHAVGNCYRKLVVFEKKFGDTEYHLKRASNVASATRGQSF
jgi:alkylation response protein AidB-like acyl-CoA dehydrogenase